MKCRNCGIPESITEHEDWVKGPLVFVDGLCENCMPQGKKWNSSTVQSLF